MAEGTILNSQMLPVTGCSIFYTLCCLLHKRRRIMVLLWAVHEIPDLMPRAPRGNSVGCKFNMFFAFFLHKHLLAGGMAGWSRTYWKTFLVTCTLIYVLRPGRLDAPNWVRESTHERSGAKSHSILYCWVPATPSSGAKVSPQGLFPEAQGIRRETGSHLEQAIKQQTCFKGKMFSHLL